MQSESNIVTVPLKTMKKMTDECAEKFAIRLLAEMKRNSTLKFMSIEKCKKS